MWYKLEKWHQQSLAYVEEHQELCRAATPDRHALAAVRWRLAQVGRSRVEFLLGTAFPAAEAACMGIELRQVGELRDATPAYQQLISAHVMRWSSNAMVVDWAGYGVVSRQFRAVIMARIADEAEILRPVLRRIDLIAQLACGSAMPPSGRPASPSDRSRLVHKSMNDPS